MGSTSGAKPFYASKVLWMNGFAALAAIAESQGWINTNVSQQIQIALLAAVNIVLRIVTRDSIVLG
jgi:hypothetical protein